MVPLRMFLVLWDKKISTEKRDIPLLCLKIFDTKKSETIKGSFSKSFATVRQKDFDKIVILLQSKTILIPVHFWNTDLFPREVFRRCEKVNTRQKIVIFLIFRKFRYQNNSETNKGSHTKIFGTVRQNSSPKSVTYSYQAQMLSIPRNIKTLKSSPTKSFRTV